ncbi:MAG: DUF2817 domain-containing protein [Rhodopirellula sp.]|nr:DUF2817 domain-containing protein [Rhodopirellula sp.]
MRHQVSNDQASFAALAAATLALMAVTAFLLTTSGATTRGWVQQKQTDSSPASLDKSTITEPTTTPDVSKVASVETIVGHSVEGRPLVCRTIGDGEYVVLMMASIHGNEAAGTPLLNDLAKQVVETPDLLTGVTLVLLPVVNPDGVESGQRYNARGVDLNRNFPAENRQNSSRYGLNALSEPESLAIYQVINDTLPNHIVTLHEPLQCVDYDGPAKELAAVMSEFCPLPVKKLGSRPGSLGSYTGVTLGIPTITFELPGNAATQSPELLWRFYGEALIQAVLYRHPTSE